MPDLPPILIAGGGIGGLATALALARAGHKVEVLERAPSADAVGAGIQLGPNAVKILRRLGIDSAVRARASMPDALVLRQGTTGRQLSHLRLGPAIETRHGAPYWVVHRADLHSVLYEAVVAAGCTVRTDSEVRSVTGLARAPVIVTTRGGAMRIGAALIGADGVWSRVRQILAPDFAPVMSGFVAYRTIIPAAQAGVLNEMVVGAWLSPAVHVVHYPIRAGHDINVVVIVPDLAGSDDWSVPADAAAVTRATAALARPLCDALAAAPSWQRWSLAKPVQLPVWSRGPVALLGDAAHAMPPFLAQGGAMALEDAVVMAGCVAGAGQDLPAAFAAFAALRRGRVARVQNASVLNGRIFHLTGLSATARDTTLRLMPQDLLQGRFDWLYGHEPP